jgi:hypothetical protein
MLMMGCGPPLPLVSCVSPGDPCVVSHGVELTAVDPTRKLKIHPRKMQRLYSFYNVACYTEETHCVRSGRGTKNIVATWHARWPKQRQTYSQGQSSTYIYLYRQIRTSLIIKPHTYQFPLHRKTSNACSIIPDTSHTPCVAIVHTLLRQCQNILCIIHSFFFWRENLHQHIHIHMHTRAYMQRHKHSHMRTRTQIYVHTHVQTHLYLHTHTHTHVYITI